MKKTKKFDCVEMKHKGAQRLLKKLSELTPEQELEFWQKRTEALLKTRQKILAKAKADLTIKPD